MVLGKGKMKHLCTDEAYLNVKKNRSFYLKVRVTEDEKGIDMRSSSCWLTP